MCGCFHRVDGMDSAKPFSIYKIRIKFTPGSNLKSIKDAIVISDIR